MSRAMFGRIVAAPVIERGVEVCLRYFLGVYLGEVLEQNGYARDALADPAGLERVVDLNDFPSASQLALVVVATPGTVGDSMSDGGAYTAAWTVSAGAIVDTGDAVRTREAAQLYAAAIGAAIAHQGVAAVEADGVTWQRDAHGELVSLEGAVAQWGGERYRVVDRLRPDVIAGEALIRVTVEGARSMWAPDVPDPGEPTDPLDRDPPADLVPAPVDPTISIDRRTPLED